MKTELQKQLATIAPSISIETIWEHDPDLRDIRQDCDGFETEDPDDWQAWQAEICATIIINGEEQTGHAYLGGTWERAGNHPSESNPDISGYECQMTVEAVSELPECPDREAALLWLKGESERQYQASRATVEA